MMSCRWTYSDSIQRIAHVMWRDLMWVTFVTIFWDSNRTFPERCVGLFWHFHGINVVMFCSNGPNKQEVTGVWYGLDIKLGETRIYTKFCWGKPQGKLLQERSKSRWKINTNVDAEGMGFLSPELDRTLSGFVLWRHIVNIVTDLIDHQDSRVIFKEVHYRGG